MQTRCPDIDWDFHLHLNIMSLNGISLAVLKALTGITIIKPSWTEKVWTTLSGLFIYFATVLIYSQAAAGAKLWQCSLQHKAIEPHSLLRNPSNQLSFTAPSCMWDYTLTEKWKNNRSVTWYRLNLCSVTHDSSRKFGVDGASLHVVEDLIKIDHFTIIHQHLRLYSHCGKQI